MRSIRAQTTSASAKITAIYQAPDRAERIEQPGTALPSTPSVMTITHTLIGKDIYNQVRGQAPQKTALKGGVSGHLAALNQVLQPILVLATAKTATATGDTYRFSAIIHARQPGATDIIESGTADVQGGFITRITSEGTGVASGQSTTTFDEVDTAPPVQPPNP